MIKPANRFAANPRLLLLRLEALITIAEDLLVVAEESEDEEERVKDKGEALTSYSMSPSNIMILLTMRSFRTIRPCW